MRIPVEIPPGIIADASSHAASGRWLDGSNVRFSFGKPRTIGGWESVTGDLLGGVCRSAFPWTDNDSRINIAFGTHQTLEVYQGGELYDITPTLGLPARSRTVTAVDASTTYTVADPNHRLATGDTVIITGDSIARATLAGTTTITVVDDDSYTFVDATAADQAKTLAADPISTTLNSTLVTISEPGHNIADGTRVTISGATAVGGITLSGEYAITVVDANTYTVESAAPASSTATGGGAAVVVTVPLTGTLSLAPQNAFSSGEVDGTGSAGYGTGGYGVGAYGSPSTADYFPRTWSFGAFGENLMACPRGQTIMRWQNDTGVVAAPLENAPQQVTYMLVATSDQVFALGCSEEVSGTFNPLCIRHSGVRDATEWNTASDTTAREYVLPGGGRIVGGRVMGDYILVWTDHALFLGTFLRSLNEPWRFTRVGTSCGLAGPNAAVVVGQTAFWTSPDKQFYTYQLGGAPQALPCTVRRDYEDYLAAAQADKIVASSIGSTNEVWWDYPDSRDGEGLENSRYLAFTYGGTDAGAWLKGQMARTARVDAGPTSYPIGVTAEGNIYWQERGHTADGSALSWFLESADNFLDEERQMMVRGLWPDVHSQEGPVTLTLTIRDRPLGTERTSTYTIAPGDEKTDIRATGRLVKIKLSGSSSPALFHLGTPVFDVTPAGKR